MLVPTITAHTDPNHRIVTVSVTGPLFTVDHTSELLLACGGIPHWYGLLVDLSGVTVISDTGLQSLRERAKAAALTGQRLVFVCSEQMLRCELLLADLDTLAPVLPSADDAIVVAALAA